MDEINGSCPWGASASLIIFVHLIPCPHTVMNLRFQFYGIDSVTFPTVTVAASQFSSNGTQPSIKPRALDAIFYVYAC
jgi:hypothetical protein